MENQQPIIDFDAASFHWKQNKKRIDNGCYIYVCMGITSKFKNCLNRPVKSQNFCHVHLKK